MGLLISIFVLGRLAGLPKNCICCGLSKDIHSVSLRPCQEKFFAFNGEPAIFRSLKHTSKGTLELDHDACPPVNSFTPNHLILTIFNEAAERSLFRRRQTLISHLFSMDTVPLNPQQMPGRFTPGELR
jgi:hypothetical protein